MLTPCGCSTTHRNNTHAPLFVSVRELYDGMKLYCTSGVWLKSELILGKLPRVIEVATNHWVYLSVIGHLTLFDFITDPRLRKMSIFVI